MVAASIDAVKSKIDEEVNLKDYVVYDCKTIEGKEEITWILRAKRFPFGKTTRENKDIVLIGIERLNDMTEITINSRPYSKHIIFDNGRNLERILALEKELKAIV